MLRACEARLLTELRGLVDGKELPLSARVAVLQVGLGGRWMARVSQLGSTLRQPASES